MKNFTRVFALSTIALAMVTGSAYAADRPDCSSIQGFSGKLGRDLYPGNCGQANPSTPKSRDQVQAELASAQQNGDIVAGMGFTQRELSHGTIGPVTVASDNTREQVKAELAQAQRNGDIVAGMGFTQRELSHGTIGPVTVASTKTREQVYSELVQWKKTGGTN
jgi:ribosomal protein L30E